MSLDRSIIVDSLDEVLKNEDSPSAAGDALVPIGVVRQDTPTVDTSASGNYSWIKANQLGVIYSDPSHKALSFVNGSLSYVSAPSSGFNTLITNTNKGRILNVFNNTDVAVVLSSDGTNNSLYVDAGQNIVFDLASNGLWWATNVQVKSMATGTTGTIYGALLY